MRRISNPHSGGCCIGGTLKGPQGSQDNTEGSKSELMINKFIVSEVDLAWLAGIVDGEGCLTIFRRTNKSSSGSRIISPAASATITNSNLSLMVRCMEILDFLGVKYRYINPRNSNKRPLRRIQIRNYDSLRVLIRQIKPYLIAKTNQALMLEEFLGICRDKCHESVRRKSQLLGLIQAENHYGSLIL